jgi:protease-4
MKKWFLGVITGFFLAFTLITLSGILVWYLGERAPDVEPGTTLVLELKGDIAEQDTPDLAQQLLGDRLTFVPFIRTIEKAATDERIDGILLKPSRLGMGWAKLQEIRQSLVDFQSTGKKITAVLSVAGTREYYLASVADRIYLSPVGFLDVKGMRAEVLFFKDGLAKLGVQADLEQIGVYKNFADQFKTNRMSDAFREAITAILDSTHEHFLASVADARGTTLEEVRELVEQTGPFEARRAKLAGLVDDLLYEDEVRERLQGNGEDELTTMKFSSYRRVPWPGGKWDFGKRIAVIYAVGNITSGTDGGDIIFGGKTLGADTMAEVVETVTKDESIKGVVVRIDSSGGDAFASDDIWRQMNRLSDEKPVVFSMSDAAASGGYYLAMTGDPIVAEPSTLTGSIGIIYGKLNLKGLYDKLGIHKERIARGRFSGLDSDYGSYTPEERERVRGFMNEFYTGFITKVAAARNMKPEEVDRIAQGRVWTGEQALKNGLVDEIGGFQRALELVKEKAGIPAADSVQLVEFPRRKTIIELLLSRASQAQARTAVLLEAVPSEWQRLEAIASSSMWAVMPAQIDLR